MTGFGQFRECAYDATVANRQFSQGAAALGVDRAALGAAPDAGGRCRYGSGLMCWLVNVGLFILWQPFIQAERRLDASSLLLFVLLLAGGAWLFGWWLLILWVTALASLLGGRVMLLGHRPTRIYYLLAFAYLLVALLVWLVPKVVPDAAAIGPSLDRPFAWLAPLIFFVMLLLY